MPIAKHGNETRKDPAGYMFEITPEDYDGYPTGSTVFTETRGIHVNVGGIIMAIPARNLHAHDVDPVELVVNSGCTYPFALVAIESTGTTASGIVGLL